MVDYVLPPLKPRPTYHRFEANLLKWREAVVQRRAASKSIFGRAGYAIANRFLGREIRSGRKLPWLLRLWYFFGRIITGAFGERRTSTIVQRAFDPGESGDSKFYSAYVITNFITGCLLFWLACIVIPYGIEGAYIFGTHRQDKYTNVRITSHYPDFNVGPHVFSVHGMYEEDGETRELFIQIGPSFLFQDYYPENVFGKISDGAICNFNAYGTLMRIPLGFRYLAGGSLYALNPWAVDATCHMPSAR